MPDGRPPAPPTLNVFAELPETGADEAVTLLASAPDGTRVERIVSRGHRSPEGFWYDQPQAEWVMLLGGAARLAFEDEAQERVLAPGDALFIPARCRHRVAWTDPDRDTVWLAVFLPADATAG